MNKFFKSRQFAILAATLLTVFYLQPAGIQFKFCFGDDGHFDLTADKGWSYQDTHTEIIPESASDDHHGKCLDLIFTSNDMVTCRPGSGLSFLNQNVNSLYSAPVLYVSNTIEEKSVNKFFSSGFLSERCSYIPSFISSIILII